MNLICLKLGDIVDRISKKDQPNILFHKDTLVEPLKLKESLRIRDGLGGHDTRPVGWPHCKTIQLTIPDLGHFWVSNN